MFKDKKFSNYKKTKLEDKIKSEEEKEKENAYYRDKILKEIQGFDFSTTLQNPDQDETRASFKKKKLEAERRKALLSTLELEDQLSRNEPFIKENYKKKKIFKEKYLIIPKKNFSKLFFLNRKNNLFLSRNKDRSFINKNSTKGLNKLTVLKKNRRAKLTFQLKLNKLKKKNLLNSYIKFKFRNKNYIPVRKYRFINKNNTILKRDKNLYNIQNKKLTFSNLFSSKIKKKNNLYNYFSNKKFKYIYSHYLNYLNFYFKLLKKNKFINKKINNKKNSFIKRKGLSIKYKKIFNIYRKYNIKVKIKYLILYFLKLNSKSLLRLKNRIKKLNILESFNLFFINELLNVLSKNKKYIFIFFQTKNIRSLLFKYYNIIYDLKNKNILFLNNRLLHLNNNKFNNLFSLLRVLPFSYFLNNNLLNYNLNRHLYNDFIKQYNLYLKNIKINKDFNKDNNNNFLYINYYKNINLGNSFFFTRRFIFINKIFRLKSIVKQIKKRRRIRKNALRFKVGRRIINISNIKYNNYKRINNKFRYNKYLLQDRFTSDYIYFPIKKEINKKDLIDYYSYKKYLSSLKKKKRSFKQAKYIYRTKYEEEQLNYKLRNLNRKNNKNKFNKNKDKYQNKSNKDKFNSNKSNNNNKDKYNKNKYLNKNKYSNYRKKKILEIKKEFDLNLTFEKKKKILNYLVDQYDDFNKEVELTVPLLTNLFKAEILRLKQLKLIRKKKLISLKFKNLFKRYCFLNNLNNIENKNIRLSYLKVYKKAYKIIYRTELMAISKKKSKYFCDTYSYYLNSRHYKNQSRILKRYCRLKIKLLRIKENKHYNTNINNIYSFINKKYKDLIKNDELNTYRNHKINKSRLNKKRIRNLNNKNNLFLFSRKLNISKKRLDYFNNYYLDNTYVLFNKLDSNSLKMYNNINLDNKKAKVTNTDSSSTNSSNSINPELLFLREKYYFLLELEKKYKNKLLNLKKLTKNNNKAIKTFIFKSINKFKNKYKLRYKNILSNNRVRKELIFLLVKSLKKNILKINKNNKSKYYRIKRNIRYLLKFVKFHNKETNLVRRRKKRIVHKIKRKVNYKIILTKQRFLIPEYVNSNYKSRINSYINNKKIYNNNLNNFINNCRKNNIFISVVFYYPKNIRYKLSYHRTNKDYIYAYWNVNSLYFKFTGFLIREGKKNKAEIIFDNSLVLIKELISNNPIFFFFKSIYNNQPLFESLKIRKRHNTFTNIRITPFHKRLNLSMRQIANNIRNSDLLRKFKNTNKQKINNSYILYYLLTSSFFIRGKVKKTITQNIENAYSKRYSFRKGNTNTNNNGFKYNRLLKFLSFKKMRGYHFT